MRARVQPHAGALLGNSGIWILVAGGAPLVSLPIDATDALSERAQGWSAADVADVGQLRAQVSPLSPRAVEKIIGPAFIGYGLADSLDLSFAELARPLLTHAQVEELQTACDPEQWDHGGSELDSERTFGVVDATNQLVALAGYEVWNGTIAHISIITHPLRRGRGFGRAAVAAAARHALGAGLTPQYRTLRENAPSIRIAQRLGFIEYGFSVYVRLRQA